MDNYGWWRVYRRAVDVSGLDGCPQMPCVGHLEALDQAAQRC